MNMERVVVVITSVLVTTVAVVNAENCSRDRFACSTARATCMDGKCVCEPQYNGLGAFACVDKPSDVCVIYNDPTVKTYAGEPHEPIHFTFPCKFPVSRFSTSSTTNGVQYECSVSIYAAQKKVGGKVFLHGYEVWIDSTRTLASGTVITGSNAFRQIANASYGNYDYDFQTLQNGVFDTMDLSAMAEELPGINWYMLSSSRTNLKVDVCKFYVIFRPVNEDDTRRIGYEMPGLMVTVDHHSGVNNFTNPQGDFCLSPDLDQYSVDQAMIDTGASDYTGSFMTRMLKSGLTQDFPGTSSQCQNLTDTAATMTNNLGLSAAEQACRFILEDPPFVNCFSRDADATDLVTFYRRCLMVIYGNSVGENCDDLWTTMEDKTCETHIPSNFPCDFVVPSPTGFFSQPPPLRTGGG